MFTIVAWRVRERGSGRRKEADVKAVRRRRAKGWRWVEVGVGRGVAWRVEVWVGERRVERPDREIVRGGGGGGGGGGSASVGMGSECDDGGGACEPADSAFPATFRPAEAEAAEEAAAALSIPFRSRFFKNSHAACTRSGVSKLMTPMVRWMAPMGRIAFAGILTASFAALGADISAEKRWREDWNCGREVGVMRGRRRKWVSWGLGFGGMVHKGGRGSMDVWRGRVPRGNMVVERESSWALSVEYWILILPSLRRSAPEVLHMR